MKSNIRTKLGEIESLGYGINVERIISKSFNIFKGIWGYGVLVILIYMVISAMSGLIVYSIMGISFSDIYRMAETNPDQMANYIAGLSAELGFMGLFLISIVGALFTALVAPLMAGILRLSFEYDKQGRTSIDALLYYYRAPYFGNIFIYTVLLGVFTGILNVLLGYIPAMGSLIYWVIYVLLMVLLVLTIPFIVFAEANWVDAFKASIKVIQKNVLYTFLALLVGILISFSGAILCGIGILITFSFVYIAQYVLYDEVIGFEEKSQIDEIGEEYTN